MRNLMEYGKARGIALLGKYLPDITPFKDIDIIASIEDWEAVKHKYGDFAIQRTDLPIGTTRQNAVFGTSGLSKEVPELIETVHAHCPEGVVLIMSTKEPTCLRYLNDGGFNVLFSINDRIIVELVGKGFDGHEITQGLAIHERYIIPWGEAYFVKDRDNLIRHNNLVYCVTDKEYQAQREKRVRFLVDECHYDEKAVEENIPPEYQKLSNDIVKELLDKVVLTLVQKKSELRRNGMLHFCVQGNFANGKVQPWEIFVPDRWA